MPYQYKREPLNDDEVDKITNACNTFREKFVVWTMLDTGVRLSELADLKKKIYSGRKEDLLFMAKAVLTAKNQKEESFR